VAEVFLRTKSDPKPWFERWGIGYGETQTGLDAAGPQNLAECPPDQLIELLDLIAWVHDNGCSRSTLERTSGTPCSHRVRSVRHVQQGFMLQRAWKTIS